MSVCVSHARCVAVSVSDLVTSTLGSLRVVTTLGSLRLSSVLPLNGPQKLPCTGTVEEVLTLSSVKTTKSGG